MTDRTTQTADALAELMNDSRWLDSSDEDKAAVADEVVEWVATHGHAVVALYAEVARLEAALTQRDEALQRIAEQQPNTLAMLRKHGVVFRTRLDIVPAFDGSTKAWEKVAFSVYTDLCEVDSIARAALAGSGGAEEQTPSNVCPCGYDGDRPCHGCPDGCKRLGAGEQTP